MMTYRTFKYFINNNNQPNNAKIFDLISTIIKSKIIFILGEKKSNTSSFLASIMSACEMDYYRFTNDKSIALNLRFLKNSTPISMESLCENAEKIIKLSKKALSGDDLYFLLALSFRDAQYTIIELEDEYYYHIKDIFPPFAIILATNDDERTKGIIDTAPIGTKEIISLSQKDDFDYISTKQNANGTRVSYASPNKVTIKDSNLLGTSFYHYSYLYHISTLDINNVSYAHLAIESASILFSAPRPYIYKGLDSARVPHDLELYSLSPAILFYEGENDFKLHHRIKVKTVSACEEFILPSENTVFYGNKAHIKEIKEKLAKR